MHIRAYVDSDAAPTLDVFRRAIRETASRHYSPEQVEVWARPDIDLDGWAQKRAATETLVSTIDDVLAGFIDIDSTGHIDMLFVSPDFGHQGVATALLAAAMASAERSGITTLSVEASLTAKPFFEKHGFVVIEEQKPILRGVEMTNFRMHRILGPSDRNVPLLSRGLG